METPKADEYSAIDQVRAQYRYYTGQYSKIIKKAEPSFTPLEHASTHPLLRRLLPEDARRVALFSTNVSSFFPREFPHLSPLEPTSQTHLQAMVASVYNSERKSGIDPDKEMYIRALIALNHFYRLHGFSKNTDELVDDFLKRPFSSSEFSFFLSSLVASTYPRPIRSDEHTEETRGFRERLKETEIPQLRILSKYIDLYNPDSLLKDVESMPIILVPGISRLRTYSNDPLLHDDRGAHKSSTMGFSFGVDTETDLPLISQTLIILPKSDEPLDDIVGTHIHELLHTSMRRRTNSDWEQIVKELLTEFGAQVIKHEAEGIAMTARSVRGSLYNNLVQFARVIVETGTISQDEMMRFAVNQDFSGYLARLSEGLTQQDDKKLATILKVMSSFGAIPPIKRAELPGEISTLRKDPLAYVQDRCMELREQVAESYTGIPEFMLKAYGRLENDEKYVQERRQVWSERNPGEEFMLGYLLRDGDLCLTDRAVDELRQIIYANSSHEVTQDGFCKAEKIIEYLKEGHWPEIKPDGVPDSLWVKKEDQARFSKLLQVMNNELGHFFIQNIPQEDKLGILVETTTRCYEEIAKGLVKNWVPHNHTVDYNDVLYFMENLLPEWFRRDGVYLQDIDEIINKVKMYTNALTSEHDINGVLRPLSKEQVLHFGGALHADADD